MREEGGKGVGKNNRNFRASDEGGDESARKGQCKSKGGHCIGGTIFRGGSDQTIGTAVGGRSDRVVHQGGVVLAAPTTTSLLPIS